MVLIHTHAMDVPKIPNLRSHLCPSPALAFDGFFSFTLTPYCLMQQVKGLFLGASLLSPSWFTGFIVAMRFGSRSCSAVSSIFRLFGRASSSLSSASGWSPALRVDGGDEAVESKVEGKSIVFSSCCFADFCSSRSPHNMSSCLLSLCSSSLSARRLDIYQNRSSK